MHVFIALIATALAWDGPWLTPEHLVERTFEQIRDDEDPTMDKALEVLQGG